MPDPATGDTFVRAALAIGAPLLDADRVDSIVAIRRAATPGVDAYRAIPLAYVGDVIEPAHATAWLEQFATPSG